MNAVSNWPELKRLFDAALALPPAQRMAWVHGCGAPLELQAELLSLLAHSTGGGHADPDFLAASAAPLPVPLVIDDLAGQRLGAWQLIEQLGSGGMGEVWLARRADGAYAGEAAVKLLKRGMDSAAVLQRFTQERQALARLNHPHIAHLFDAGLSPQSLPFFVMERVQGRPIDQVCEGLPMKERLALFLQLADAVSHAHRHLLVHRDLKPGNVLVTAEGQVKLLDFGIAKALDPSEADQTQLGERPYTPYYASPEQIRGEPVSTATDIYSLGVLLYLLLTGQRPYGRNAQTPQQAAQSVLDEEPTRPSALAPALRGDLDNILLKTLEKEPARRYATVDALRADLQAHLDGYPVSARAPSAGYLLTRFMRRHRVAVGLGGLLLLALLGGLGTTLWQMRQTEIAHRQAEQRFTQLRQLANKLVFGYHDQIAQLPGSLATREALLQDALRYLDGLAGELGSQLARDPGLARELAESYSRIAALQGDSFSPSQERLQASEQNIDKALALLPYYLGPDNKDIAALNYAGDMWQGRAHLHMRAGRLKESAEALEQARLLHERATALAPQDLGTLAHLATVTGRLGQLMGGSPTQPQLGQLDAAGPKLREAARMYERLLAREPKNAEWTHQAAWAQFLLSNWALMAGHTAEAHEYATRALALRDAAVAAEPENSNFRYQRALARAMASRVQSELGRHEEALRLMEEAIALLLAEQKRDPANQSAARDLILLRFGLARAAFMATPGELTRLALQQALHAFPPSSALAADFYMARWRAEALLWLARATPQAAQALTLAREAEMLMRATHDSADNASRRWTRAMSLGEQARALESLGQPEAARTQAEAAMALWRAGAVPPLYKHWATHSEVLARSR